MVAMYAGHDRHHLLQIETIRTGLFRRGEADGPVEEAVRKKAGQKAVTP